MRKTCSATSSCPNKVLKIEPTKQKKNTALRSVVRSLYNLVCDITIIESFANRIKQTNKQKTKGNEIPSRGTKDTRHRKPQIVCAIASNSSLVQTWEQQPISFPLLFTYFHCLQISLNLCCLSLSNQSKTETKQLQ